MTENSEKQGFDTTRFEIAPTEVADSYERELYRLLVLIAETSEPDDPEGWAQLCCVSDESLVCDFYSFLEPSKEDMEVLSGKLGFTVEADMYMVDVCAMMRKQDAR
jgi:hypothetical protein